MKFQQWDSPNNEHVLYGFINAIHGVSKVLQSDVVPRPSVSIDPLEGGKIGLRDVLILEISVDLREYRVRSRVDRVEGVVAVPCLPGDQGRFPTIKCGAEDQPL